MSEADDKEWDANEKKFEAEQKKINLNRLNFSTNHPCDECLFWARLPKNSGNGLCRRYPPKPYSDFEEGEDNVLADRLPVTFDDDYCGEFKSAKKRKP